MNPARLEMVPTIEEAENPMKQPAWPMKRSLLLTVLVLAGFCSSALAAVPPPPPEVFFDAEERAPENLVIKVLSVIEEEVAREKKQPWYDLYRAEFITFQLLVKAEVLEVKKSRTGLALGKVITFRYKREVFQPPMLGENPAPRVEEGRVYPARLEKEKEGDFYEPTGWPWFYSYNDIYRE